MYDRIVEINSTMWGGCCVGSRHLMRVGGGLLLAITLSVGMVALPAGAATKNASPVSHSASTTSFALVVASLQGHTVKLSNGTSCTVSGTSCIVTTSGDGQLTQGTSLTISANSGGRQSHLVWQIIGFGEGAGGLAESIWFIVMFW